VADDIRCTKCNYAGQALNCHKGYRWYYFLLALTGVGLLPLVVLLVVLGNQTNRACPACGEKAALAAFAGERSPNAQEIWNAASSLDAQRFKRNQLITASVLMALMVAAFAIVYAIV
jgi:predicted RNA-binding Zn-ribbon protein involved in translation (DUF1610 family)